MITIQGIRLCDIKLVLDKDTGLRKISTKYELMSSTGVVMASMNVNEYNGMDYTPSAETTEALNKLSSSILSDLNRVLGLTT